MAISTAGFNYDSGRASASARAQCCLHLANETRDKAIADASIGLAAKSLERAADLEERRKPQKLLEEGTRVATAG